MHSVGKLALAVAIALAAISVAPVAIDDGTSGVASAQAVVEEGNERWNTSEDGRTVYRSPDTADGVVVYGSSMRLVAASTDDGSELWNVTLPSYVGEVRVADGKVLANVDNNGLWAVDLDNGSTVWTVEQMDLWAQDAAVADGTVYIASEGGRVRAINLDDGSIAWNVSVGSNPVRSGPTLHDGMAVVGDSGGTVTALSQTDGSQVWQNSTFSAYVYGNPAVGPDGRALYVGDGNGRAYRINDTTGNVAWNRSIAPYGWLDASPRARYGKIYYGSACSACGDHELIAVDETDGSVVWNDTTVNDVSGFDVVDGEVIYTSDYVVGSHDADDGSQVWKWEGDTSKTNAPYIRDGPHLRPGTAYVGAGAGGVYAISTGPTGDFVGRVLDGDRDPFGYPGQYVGETWFVDAAHSIGLLEGTSRFNSLDFATVRLSDPDEQIGAGGTYEYAQVGENGEYQVSGCDQQGETLRLRAVYYPVVDNSKHTASKWVDCGADPKEVDLQLDSYYREWDQRVEIRDPANRYDLGSASNGRIVATSLDDPVGGTYSLDSTTSGQITLHDGVRYKLTYRADGVPDISLGTMRASYDTHGRTVEFKVSETSYDWFDYNPDGDNTTDSVVREPTAMINATPLDPTTNDTVTLDAGGSVVWADGSVSYDWSVGGQSLSGETVTYNPSSNGTLNISLTVTDDLGHSDTANRSLWVANESVGDVPTLAPIADYQASPASAGPGQLVTFNASPSVYVNPQTRYFWYRSDGPNGSLELWDRGETTDMAFDETGAHTVKLVVEKPINSTASDSITFDYHVNPQPSDTGLLSSFGGGTAAAIAGDREPAGLLDALVLVGIAVAGLLAMRELRKRGIWMVSRKIMVAWGVVWAIIVVESIAPGTVAGPIGVVLGDERFWVIAVIAALAWWRWGR